MPIEQIPIDFEGKKKDDEFERMVEAGMKKHPDWGEEYVREWVQSSINIRKSEEKEKKRYPGGKHYEGRDTD